MSEHKLCRYSRWLSFSYRPTFARVPSLHVDEHSEVSLSLQKRHVSEAQNPDIQRLADLLYCRFVHYLQPERVLPRRRFIHRTRRTMTCSTFTGTLSPGKTRERASCINCAASMRNWERQRTVLFPVFKCHDGAPNLHPLHDMGRIDRPVCLNDVVHVVSYSVRRNADLIAVVLALSRETPVAKQRNRSRRL
jgi:hypothetical protein